MESLQRAFTVAPTPKRPPCESSNLRSEGGFRELTYSGQGCFYLARLEGCVDSFLLPIFELFRRSAEDIIAFIQTGR